MLKGGGALIVSFSFAGADRRRAGARRGPAAKPLALTEVDAFLAIDSKGMVTVYSGKVDLGTGVIDRAAGRWWPRSSTCRSRSIKLVTATPRSRPTRARPGAASRSSSAACRSATRRRPRGPRCVDEAAKRLGAKPEELNVADGVISAGGKQVQLRRADRRQVVRAQARPRQAAAARTPRTTRSSASRCRASTSPTR